MSAKLLNLINRLQIADFETNSTPYSTKDLNIIKLQLKIALIIAKDAKQLSKTHSGKTTHQLVAQLADVWRENIKDFAIAIMELENSEKV